jgi:hypothetical protein
MRTFLFTSTFCGLLLMGGLNAVAEPIDQRNYLASGQQQIEKREHSWPDGRLYNGEWLGDQPHGQGMLTYPDGGQYWGRFSAGKRQGDGMMKFINGDEYEGQWFDDQPHGNGTQRYADGARHEGNFERGQPSGQGRRTYPDGTYYDGQWLQNVPHGFGRLTFVSGGAYEGQFQKGKPHGRGIYFFANGDLYEGEWKQGQQDGQGRFDYATGGFYEGTLVQGKRQGKGVWVTALGQRYEGSFSANQPHGAGRCGSLAKMTPCTYRNGKRMEDTAPAVVAVAETAVPASKPLPAAPVAKQPITLASASQPVVDVPVAAMTTAVATSAPLATTPPAPAQTTTTIATAIPASPQGETFARTLTQEKQRATTKTLADLDPKRSDIFFNDSWSHLDLMAQPGRVWWKKNASLFQDQLEILSQHGDTRIRMLIDDYKGPGRYALSQVRVESPSQSFEASSDEAGHVDIQSDSDGWISGQFQFNVQTANGRALDIRDGVFRISDISSQPRFLR